MSRTKKLLFIGGGVVFVFFLLITMFVLLRGGENSSPPEDFLIERPDTPAEEWPRIIEEEELENNKKQLTNRYDGYQIIIPSSWQILDQSKTLNAQILSVYKQSTVQTAAERIGVEPEQISDIDMFHAPVVLKIHSEKKRGSRLLNWLEENPGIANPTNKNFTETEVNTYTAYRAEDVILGQEGPIENSLQTFFVLQSQEQTKAYILTCFAEGENYLQEATQCEEAVQTFTLLR